MRIFGSWTELVSTVFRKDTFAITVRPSQTVSYSADTDIQLPPSTAAQVLVGASATQTLTNKTLSGNTASNLINGSGTLNLNSTGAITVPNATDTLVGKATTDTLTNKTLTGNTAVNLVSGSGTFTFNTTGTLTAPNATDTLVGRATTDTLTNKTLTGNTAVNLISGAGTLTLNTSGTVTVPNATDTLVGKATTDTLTNKTLTTPVISSIVNTGTLTLPTSTDTLVGRATTDTLTNKTLIIDGGSADVFQSASGTARQIKMDASGATNSTASTIVAVQTTNRSLTLPDTTDFIVPAAQIGNMERNFVFNGNFDVWQRGTTGGLSSGGVFVADRWAVAGSAAYTTSQSRSTDVPTQSQSGFNSVYSLLQTNGTGASPGANDYFEVQYKIEGQDYQRLHANKMRMQFWVKSSVTGTFSLTFSNSAETRGYTATYTISSANTWEKKTIDLTADTTGTWGFDNTTGLFLSFNLAAGSNLQTSTTNQWRTSSGADAFGATGQTQWAATTGATFRLAQVMLIPNDYSSMSTFSVPFQRAGRTIEEEIALCKRYYHRPNYDTAVDTGIYTVFGNGMCLGTGSTNIFVQFPVTMVAPPTFGSSTASNLAVQNATGSQVALTTIALNDASEKATTGMVLSAAVSLGLVAGNATVLMRNGTTAGYVEFNAELA